MRVTALGSQSGSTSRIEEGVNLVDPSGTVLVGPGTFPGDSNVAKTVTLKGNHFGDAVGGRTFGDATESTINGTTTLQATGITLDGFSVTHPAVTINDSANGVVVKTAGSGATISNNIFKNITNTDPTTSDGQAAAQAIYLENGPDAVSITNNKISDISSPRSAKGVLIGDSTASSSSTGIVITGNTITNVTSVVRGAYGIQTNNAVGAELDIENNTISNLTASAAGGWIHAIGLENDTPNTTVSHNVISGFTSPSANQVAVWIEGPNGVYQTVAINRNSLDVGSSAAGIFVDPTTPANGPVSGTCNWWGSSTGPGAIASGSGSLVSSKVTYSPWLVSSNLNGSCTTIAISTGAGAHPNPANGNEGDTLTVNGSFTSPSPVAPTITADNAVGFGTFTDHHNGHWTWTYATTDNYATTTVNVTATDENGSQATDAFDTTANNVAPTAAINAPAAVLLSSGFQVSLTSPNDVSSADVTAGFTYAFDCGSGTFGSFSASSTANCTAPATPGNITVRGTIMDKDGGSTTYHATVNVAGPQVQLTPASKNYGNVLIGSTSPTTTFTVTNTSTSTRTLSSEHLAGLKPNQFGIDTDNCFNAVLAPNDTCTIEVDFAPTSAGAKSATLVVQSDDPVHPSVSSALSGTGVTPAAGITLTPSSKNFGSEVIGNTTATTTFTVTSNGTAALSVLSVGLSGTNADQFSVTNNGCLNAVLPPTHTCDIKVSFSPTTSGPKTASLDVGSNDPAHATVSSSLTGTGTTSPTPEAQLTPSSKNFSNVLVGSVSPTTTFTVTNIGTAALSISDTHLSGLKPNQFGIDTNDCFNAVIQPAHSCDIKVDFAPTSAGAKAATLVVQSNDPVHPSVSSSLSGNGVTPVAGIALTPSGKAFGGQLVGSQSATTTFTVTSNGTAALSVLSVGLSGTNADQFSITNNGCLNAVLAPNATCAIKVAFAPTSVGAKSASLDVGSNDPNHATVSSALAGTGTTSLTPQAQLTPSSKDFSDVLVGSVSPTTTFTVTNIGMAALSISDTHLSGLNPNQFGIDTNNCFNAVLTPNGTCTVKVDFAPTSAGAKAATLVVQSNDPVHPSVSSSLSGNGVTPVAGIALTPSGKAFGGQLVGSQSATTTFTVTSNGTAALSVLSVGLSGTNADQFSITNNGCLNAVLAPNATCAIKVAFAPTSVGAKSASLDVGSNDPNHATVSSALAGTGTSRAMARSRSSSRPIRPDSTLSSRRRRGHRSRCRTPATIPATHRSWC